MEKYVFYANSYAIIFMQSRITRLYPVNYDLNNSQFPLYIKRIY